MSISPSLFDLPETAKHPARFTSAHIEFLAVALEGYIRVLDGFAGTGNIHKLARFGHETVGVEIQPKWCYQHPRTILGNAFYLPVATASFDAYVTSCTFGNRMADHHNAKDGSKRHTYRHYHGSDLHLDNTGLLQWGPRYRDAHEKAWAEASRVVRSGGRFVLNCKDPKWVGRLLPVTAWHVECLSQFAWKEVERWELPTKGLAHGANYDVRAGAEYLIAFER